MAITRRDFLKYTAVTGAALYLGIFDLDPIKAYAADPPIWLTEALSVGPYCSGGCGIIVGKGTLPGYTVNDYVTYVQGNPDSIINAGRICSKCGSSAQISTIIDPVTRERVPNPARITQPLYRAAGASDWTPITWDAAISGIAAKVAATRAATWEMTDGVTVNRTRGIATLGGSSLNNEAAYLIVKLNRALGVVYLETQARN